MDKDAVTPHTWVQKLRELRRFSSAISLMTIGSTLFTTVTFGTDSHLTSNLTPNTITLAGMALLCFAMGIVLLVLAHRDTQVSLSRTLFHGNLYSGGAMGASRLSIGVTDWRVLACIMWGWTFGITGSLCANDTTMMSNRDEDLSLPEYA